MKKIPEKYKTLLEETARKISERFGKEIISVVLFGSVARGEASEKSDIDVLVVVKKRTPELEREIIGIAYDSLLKYGKYISIKVYGENEFSRPTPFLENVSKEGITIYG